MNLIRNGIWYFYITVNNRNGNTKDMKGCIIDVFKYLDFKREIQGDWEQLVIKCQARLEIRARLWDIVSLIWSTPSDLGRVRGFQLIRWIFLVSKVLPQMKFLMCWLIREEVFVDKMKYCIICIGRAEITDLAKVTLPAMLSSLDFQAMSLEARI